MYIMHRFRPPATLDRADEGIGPCRGAKRSPDTAGIGGLGRYGCLYRVTVASTLPARGLWTVRVKGVPGWALTT